MWERRNQLRRHSPRYTPLSALLIAVVALCGCTGVRASDSRDESDVAWYAAKQYGDESSRRHDGMDVSSRYLSMRDDVKIAIDLLLPKTDVTTRHRP